MCDERQNNAPHDLLKEVVSPALYPHAGLDKSASAV